MSGTVIFVLVLYYMVVLGIGYWAMQKGGGEDLEGYLLGGRKIGPMTTENEPIEKNAKNGTKSGIY